MALMQQAQARLGQPPGGGATAPQAPEPAGGATPPGAQPGARPGAGGSFKKPDISQFVPPNMVDVVQRIAAAGMKVMYSPDTRQQLMQEVQRNVPVAQKLAEGVVGLMLTLDKQSQGGIPAQAIFPAAMELLGEAAEVLSAAGQQVTQEDYNDAARLMFVLLARKLGAHDQQIQQAAQSIVSGGSQQPPEAGEGTPPEQGAPTEEPEAA